MCYAATAAAVALALCLGSPAAAQEGRTIWGDDYPSTVRAMKEVAKALGVKSCLHCHVKEGGRIVYEADTPNKQIARRMRFAFVDSLVAMGRAEIDLAQSERQARIRAVYTPEGDSAGIHLAVALPPKDKQSQERIYRARLDLPPEGEALSCATCHRGRLHFMTEDAGPASDPP